MLVGDAGVILVRDTSVSKVVVSSIDVRDKWGNSVRGSTQRPLTLTTKSKCLDRNKPHTLEFQVSNRP